MRFLARVLVLGALASICISTVQAQQERRLPRLKPAADSTLAPAVAVTTDTAVRLFSPSQVPLEADRTTARAFELSVAGMGTESNELLAATRALLDSLSREERVADLSREHLLTRRGLADLNVMWNARSHQVHEWRRALQRNVSEVDTARTELAALLVPWRRTAAAFDSTVSPDVRGRTQQVLDDAGRVQYVLATRADTLVRTELELSNAGNLIFAELQDIAAATAQMRREILRIESPPLWKSPTGVGGYADESRGGATATLSELRWFLGGNAERVVLHVLLTLLAILLMRAHRRRVGDLGEGSRTFAERTGIVQRPVAAIVLVSLSIVLWSYPRAPLAVYDVTLVFAAVPLLLLIPEVIPPDLHATARIALGMLVLQRVSTIATLGTPSFRLVQFALSVAGAALLWHALRPSGPLRVQTPRWRAFLGRLASVLCGAFVVAIAANLIGNLSLAEIINSGVALSLYLALFVHTVTQVVDIALSTAIRLGARESRYLAERGERLERVVVSIVGLASVFVWARFSLQGFLIWQPVQAAFLSVLRASLTVGKVSISVDMVLMFLLVLYLGTQLARLVSGIIQLDVMGRMDLRRGVAMTVGSLLRYALVAVAFLLSLAAVGIDLGNIAILGGALGVGIGFGLQNIVNNFISGLLLAFERPVGIGDTVQVGANTGEVKEIGIRASVIRTLEGAEVIVPNSELITQDVINWTRTGTRRRIEVAVGVAYGNDPAKVIELLTDVALQHPDVRGNPKPFALFNGFGDSSLDFVLRAWTDSLDWHIVRSDVAVAVASTLKEAGIEIPFPQRDLHLRSVDADALKDLRGEATQA